MSMAAWKGHASKAGIETSEMPKVAQHFGRQTWEPVRFWPMLTLCQAPKAQVERPSREASRRLSVRHRSVPVSRPSTETQSEAGIGHPFLSLERHDAA